MSGRIDQALLEACIVDYAQILQDAQCILILLESLGTEAPDIYMLSSADIAVV